MDAGAVRPVRSQADARGVVRAHGLPAGQAGAEGGSKTKAKRGSAEARREEGRNADLNNRKKSVALKYQLAKLKPS